MIIVVVPCFALQLALTSVDFPTFSTRELGGLMPSSVIDAQFHPLSDTHVIVLSRDGLRAYDLRSTTSSPCAAWLFPPGALHGSLPVAFSFGAARGWELFSIFVLTTSGSLYIATPILPPGILLPSADWQELRRDLEAALSAQGPVQVRAHCRARLLS